MKKSLSILAIVVVLLVGSVVFYKFYPKQNTLEKAYAEITIPGGQETETFFDSYFNLKITYPKGWYFRNIVDGGGSRTRISNIDFRSGRYSAEDYDKNFNLEMGYADDEYKGEPIAEWLEKFENDFGFLWGIKVQSTKFIKIDGRDAIMQIGGDNYSIYIPYKNYIIGILGPVADGEYGDIFLQTINSIKFNSE